MDSFIFQILPFLILFIFPIFSYANSPISVHFNQSGIKLRNRQWAQVQLQAKGNHPPFQYSYTLYPKTWKFVNQYMYIPIQYFKADQIYPCRVKITDQSNNHIQALFGIQIENSSLSFLQKVDQTLFNGINTSDYIDLESSKKITLDDLKKNQLFLTDDQIIMYRKKVDKLNSGILLKSTGSGLTQLYSQNSSQPGSLVQALNPALLLKKNQLLAQPQEKFQKNMTLNQSNLITPSIQTLQPDLKPSIRNLSVQPQPSQTVDTSEKTHLASKLLEVNSTNGQLVQKIDSTNIDNLIVNLTREDLLSLVQDVSSDKSFSCGQKTLILNDILARVYSAIEMKDYVREQVESVIQVATKDLNTVIFQINQLKSEETTTTTQIFRQKLLVQLSTVQNLYAQFNDVDTSTASLQLQLENLRENINKAQNQAKADSEQLSKQKQILMMLNTSSQNIENQLNQNKVVQRLKQKQLQDLQNQVLLKNEQLAIIVDELQNLLQTKKMGEQQLRQKQFIQNKTSDDVDELKKNISIMQEREKLITYELSNLSKQITSENSRVLTLFNLFDNQLKVLTELVSIRTSFEKLTNSILVKCFVAQPKFDFSFQTTFNSLSQFNQYIKDTYLCGMASQIFMPRSNMQLQLTRITDQKWVKAYNSFNSFYQNTLIDKTNYFNCKGEEFLVSGSGILLRIEKYWLLIENSEGNTIKLYLFYCTRIQSFENLPRVGQTLFWRGKQNRQNNQYYIERLTCF